jgi:histidinol-phosphatase (PHP family)
VLNDYHVHTYLCGHAEGTPRECVERAIELGLGEIGFADHLPMVRYWEPGLSMRREQLDEYVEVVLALGREYRGEVKVLLGVEADYFEGAEEETEAVLRAHPFDYVIGSVHYVNGRDHSHPVNRMKIPEYGVDRLHAESARLVAQAAATGLFTVFGHLDLPKKFGHQPEDAAAAREAWRRAVRAIAAAGAAVELNTAGWRQAAAEQYPASELLAEAARLGVPLTFGSDAHRAADVGFAFGRAAEAARAAGFARTVRLSDGGPEPLPEAAS